MRQVIKHRDIRLLNMIRRTDPVIPNQSTPVLRIGNNSVIGYSDVVRLMNGEGNDDYNIGW